MFGDDYEFDINDSEIHFDQGSDLLFGDQYDYNIDTGYGNQRKASDMRVLSPKRVELLADLLRNEERMERRRVQSPVGDDSNKQSNFLYDFFSKVFAKSKSEERNEKPFSCGSSKHELDDPDTPPSSPINLPNE